MISVLLAVANGFVTSVPLIAATWLVLRLTRRWLNAATRYWVWWLALVIAVALPLAYLPNRVAEKNENGSVVARIESPQPAIPTPVVLPTQPPGRASRLPIPFVAPIWADWIMRVWVFLAALSLVRLIVSAIMLDRRRRDASPSPQPLQTQFESCLRLVRARRRPPLAITNVGRSPLVCGFHRVTVLIPAAIATAFDESEIAEICLHEAAHVARYDDWTLIFQRLIEALFVIHPAVRWIGREIDLEREIACDDHVIAATGRARSYASCLTRVAEIANGAARFPFAAAAADERSHLTRRINAILDRSRGTSARFLRSHFVVIAAGIVLSASLVWRTPALIAAAESMDLPPAPTSISAPMLRMPIVPQVIKKQARTINLFVSVTEPNHRFVTGLDRDDFTIFENGVKQNISSFAGDSEDVRVYAGALRPGIFVAMDQAIKKQDTELTRLRAIYKEQFPGVVAANRERDRLIQLKEVLRNDLDPDSSRVSVALAPPTARRALVTEFVCDDPTQPQLGAVTPRARGVLEYGIALQIGRESSCPGWLRESLERTGGRLFEITDSTEIAQIKQRIEIELRNLYVITYTPKDQRQDNSYRQIRIEAGAQYLPSLTAHTIPGYYATPQ